MPVKWPLVDSGRLPVRIVRRGKKAMMRRLILAISACLTVALFGAAHASADAEPWSRWQAHDPHASATIDHAAWDTLLHSYLELGADGIARFTYSQVSAADRALLDTYIMRQARLPISSFNREEQFAYWVNLYNALTVQVVLDHYPVASIRDIDISPGLFAIGPWGKVLLTIEDEALTLDDIEHRILRPHWRDPRVHYVLNCASIGCPNLPSTALTAKNLEKMLDGAAAAYINHPRGAHVQDGKFYVSSIYDWFGDDFGDGSDAAIIAHLRRYAAPALANALKSIDEIEDDHYDWSLNDALQD
jgi:hypothetical protein